MPQYRRLTVLLILSLLALIGGTAGSRAAATSGVWRVIGAASGAPTLYQPGGIALDAAGNMYVADAGNDRVVEISPAGRVLAHFGDADLRPGPSGMTVFDGNPPPPASLAVDRRGTVYVADAANGYVRVFNGGHLTGDWPVTVPDAAVRRLALAIGGRGNIILALVAQVSCAQDCATYVIVQHRSPSGALLSSFHTPIGPSGEEAAPEDITQLAVTVDKKGNIVVAAGGVLQCYKSCPSFQHLTRYSSSGTVLNQWDQDGLSVAPSVTGLAVGGSGNLFIADGWRNLIQKRNTAGSVIGAFHPPAVVKGGMGNGPAGVAVDRAGNIFLTDPAAGRVLELSSSGKFKAQWSAGGSTPGRFWFPRNAVLDGHGGVWVADTGNNRVQHLSLAGKPLGAFAVPGMGPALALDTHGNLYLGQTLNNSVWISKYSPAGKVLASWGHFHLEEPPFGLAVAPSGDVFAFGPFVFPYNPNQTQPSGTYILKLYPSGRQLALQLVSTGVVRGALAVDAHENTFVAYGSEPRLEKRSPTGALLASSGTFSLTDQTFDGPRALAVDPAGNVWMAETPASQIMEFSPALSVLRTVGFPGSYPGQFHQPAGISAGAGGLVVVADTGNHRLQSTTFG